MEDKVYENAGTTIAPDGKRYANDDPNRPTSVPAPRGKFVTSSAFDEDPRIGTVDRVVEAMTRSIDDGILIDGDATFESADADFTAADVGASITGGGLPTGTTIESVTDQDTVELSDAPDGIGGRKVTDGGTTSGDATVTSLTAAFTSADIGSFLIGSAGIPADATIVSINSATSVEISANASATGTNRTFTILPADTRDFTIVRELSTYIDAADDALQAQIDALP